MDGAGPFAIDGRVAVVTGASSGIGLSLATGLAEAGARVVIAARRTERLEALAEKLGAEGAEILHYVAGVLDQQTGGTSRTIDTAINTAGVTDWTDANSMDPYSVHLGAVLAHGFGRMLEGSMADVRIYDEGCFGGTSSHSRSNILACSSSRESAWSPRTTLPDLRSLPIDHCRQHVTKVQQ